MSSSSPSQPSGRDAILEAALRLIAKTGYAGMTISQLSAASGLPASSIYYHFGSKHGVLAAVIEQGFLDFHEMLPRPNEFEGEPLDRLDQWFTQLSTRLNQKPDFLRLLITVCVEHRENDTAVQEMVARIRRYGLDLWVEALTPIFAADGSAAGLKLVEDLAVLGRSVADGATVAESFDGTPHLHIARPYIDALRALAAATASS